MPTEGDPVNACPPKQRDIKPRRTPVFDFDEEESAGVSEVVEWMRQLVGPDQTIAVWCKHTKIENRTRHVGGYYTSARLDQLVKDAMTYSGKAVGVHFTINPIEPELIARADHRLEANVRPPADEHILCRRILPIDIDPKRKGTVSATGKEKARAQRKADEVRKYLINRGWPEPVVVDSGNGFYLLYRVDLPADDGRLVHRILVALQQRFSDDHVEIDTTVANPARLLKIPGTMACKGKDTTDRPHRASCVRRKPKGGLMAVPRALLDALAGEAPDVQVQPSAPTSNTMSRQVTARASRYIAKMPPAVSGERGHNATLTVATRIVVGFDIPYDSEDAIQLMREYNARCLPRWDEKDLRHKLQETDRLAREAGTARGELRLDQVRPHDDSDRWEPLQGPEFLGEIPDYYWIAQASIMLPAHTLRKMSPWLGLIFLSIWRSQRSDALIPDVMARQVYWGAEHPQAWRRTIKRRYPKESWRAECREDCPLYDTDEPHQHFIRDQKCFNNELEEFRGTSVGDGLIVTRSYSQVRTYEFFSNEPGWPEKRNECIRKGLIYHAYYPALVFGLSPRIGLSPGQLRLMMGITRELTRVGSEPTGNYDKNGKPLYKRVISERRDKADLIQGRMVIASGKSATKIECPMLDEGRRYVAFAGNYKSHWGQGYRVLSWLIRAGHPGAKVRQDTWRFARSFFADLNVLANLFGFIAVGRNHERNEWKSLDDMQVCLDSGTGKRWLAGCLLRIFAPADYLVRWRYLFAQRLGFRWIPGGEECPFIADESSSADDTIGDGDGLRAWLDETGRTEDRLAKELGCSRETVSRHISGRRNSAKFWGQIKDLIGSQP